VHARKAWLQGLSPKENRNVPPLDYPLVYQLKADFPELEIIINGGIDTLDQCQTHLEQVDGVMMGREVYSNPYVMSEVDKRFYDDSSSSTTREQVLEKYIDYIDQQLVTGVRLNQLSRHAVGLFHGEPRSRLWRRHISENAHLAGSTSQVLRDAYLRMLDMHNIAV